MDQLPLQRRYAPESRCFGCGPANPDGLQIESHPVDGGLVATWTPGPNHEAFDGVLNGGIVGTLLDCHMNWTAAWHLMTDRGLDHPPSCVTADYAVWLQRPTPTDRAIELRARVVVGDRDRVSVEGELWAGGIVTASSKGTFVAVGPGHPAYGRW
ncbi:MAG TPA: PaaI family thioesterase [Candidatus Limnocylindrales bacterium]|jgi:acyl-coenzyme A thioesterase PaaI-like protein